MDWVGLAMVGSSGGVDVIVAIVPWPGVQYSVRDVVQVAPASLDRRTSTRTRPAALLCSSCQLALCWVAPACALSVHQKSVMSVLTGVPTGGIVNAHVRGPATGAVGPNAGKLPAKAKK